ncbi:MAG: UDP-N-acetylglucosamine 2-epimerase (non-hydrolyzing) [Azoarcus sp.]|jgi:UDP-GlcNAc3NAcA epimerase|nr:UDP-N-acetylglucosamine 2-epimerase (non-hydrolyzing) [Azoarcus sp.]
MKKIVTVIGARPQFIKAAVVSRACANYGIEEVVVHTGQHFDANMSDVFFDELEMRPPAHNLGIGGGSHGQNTGRMIEAVERVIIGEKPDGVLVYGDTDSTLAGALAAVKLHVPVAHVEAGLRSFNRRMPEEINRVLTDHAADWLFAPTHTAIRHLKNEGIAASKICLSGDVMFDAALFYGTKAEHSGDVLRHIGVSPKAYCLATVHRAENTDDPKRFRAILDGFNAYGLPIVLPVHPRTRAQLSVFGLTLPGNIKAIAPVGYLGMVMLEKNAALIATDSGGVQKEAFFYRVPCVTLRGETEWTELVEAGWNHLAPPGASDIQATMKAATGNTGRDVSPYGKGQAAEIIAKHLVEN